MMRAMMAAALLAIVAGCGHGGEDANGVTREESRGLDNAAAMLEVAPDLAANGEESADPDDDSGDENDAANAE